MAALSPFVVASGSRAPGRRCCSASSTTHTPDAKRSAGPLLGRGAQQVFPRVLPPEGGGGAACDTREHPPEDRCETCPNSKCEPQAVASAAALNDARTVDRVLYHAAAGQTVRRVCSSIPSLADRFHFCSDLLCFHYAATSRLSHVKIPTLGHIQTFCVRCCLFGSRFPFINCSNGSRRRSTTTHGDSLGTIRAGCIATKTSSTRTAWACTTGPLTSIYNHPLL